MSSSTKYGLPPVVSNTAWTRSGGRLSGAETPASAATAGSPRPARDTRASVRSRSSRASVSRSRCPSGTSVSR